MDKTYNPHAIEQHWYETWEQRGYFAPSGEGEPYCIMIPPPNVTGTLHMGHAFQDTLMDALIRYQRMQGRNVLWQPGTDHAGIATQMVVERQLEAEGKTRLELGREKFIERVWQWKESSGGTITRQLRRMGASVDWRRERFTMDEDLSRAVREVFVRLYDEGLIYRGQRLVNWDPVLHTALSDLEVVSREEQGHLWHMRYPLPEGEGHITVATTRPETLLGDTAVAVHPEDERYRHLIGRRVELPLTGRKIPIIADGHVDPKFGSGCVKITPAHDFDDYAIGQRHRLPKLNIFTPDARIVSPATDSPSAPGIRSRSAGMGGNRLDVGRTPYGVNPDKLIPKRYQGLDRIDARKQIVADLEVQGLLEKVEPHTHTVPRGDRSGAVIEPFLTDQWFVKVAPLADEAIRAVEDGRIRFVPGNWAKTYFEWMRRIEDWCISRQLWWGHRIPAWYDESGRLYVGHSEAEVRDKHRLGPEIKLAQDEDVLDTWFSSALWPFSTLGWPEETGALKTFYPSSVLVTGFDIIFFWIARMIMMGLKFMDDVPFREVYIHGLVRDAEGQKMSKSKGNVLDPLDLIDGIGLDALIEKRVSGLMQPQMADRVEKATRRQFPEGIPAFGTDALRFTFAVLASTGRDIKFDLQRVEGYRNFCNKLWNAARFVLMNCEGEDTGLGDAPVELSLADRWIISRLQHVEREVNVQIEHYRFDLAAQALYEFTWHDYCDWYLELTKPILQSDVKSPLPPLFQRGEQAREETASTPTILSPLSQRGAGGDLQRGTRRTLVRVLETLLRLLHPIMPFITEEIWQQAAPLAGKTGETITLQPYPSADESKIDAEAVAEMDWVQRFIMGVRRIRSEMDIAPGKPLPVLLQNWSDADRRRFEANDDIITALAKLEAVTWLDNGEAPESAIALVEEMKILIPLAGVIDKHAELARLEKETGKLRATLDKSETKLQNPQFLERAPAEVVAKERARLELLRSSLRQLEEQAEKMHTL